MKWLSKKQVKALTTLSFTEMRRREDRGEFPKRHRLGSGRYARVIYIEEEILTWMDLQIAKATSASTSP